MGRLRGRWRARSVLAGAVALVAVAVTACSSTPGGRLGAADAPPVEVSGRSIPFDSVQRWTTVSTPSRRSSVLTVFVIGSDAGGGPCGPPVIRLAAEESESSVRITAKAYQRPSSEAKSCPLVGYGPSPHRIRLSRPIGDRAVVDARDGRTRPLLVGSDLPVLRDLPAGLDEAPLAAGPQAGSSEQRWSQRGETVLLLTTVPPRSTREIPPYGRIVRQPVIRGAAAAVYQDGAGRYGQLSVQWTPNRAQTITLRLINSAHRRWTVDQAVRLAGRVTGYGVERTGRLAPPSTSGTAAASYSSADGPVRHAPNVFKSSGVYLGLDCQGDGTVTASLRGVHYRFDCTPALSHHLEQSVGAPNETVFVDITASRGVRWAATLARASLDGS